MSSFYSHSRCALKLLLDNCSEFYKKCTCIFFSIHIDKMFLCFSTNGFWTSFQTWHRKNHTSLRLHRCRARIDAGYFFFSTTLANVYVSLYWYVALRRTSTETFNMCQSAMNAVHFIECFSWCLSSFKRGNIIPSILRVQQHAADNRSWFHVHFHVHSSKCTFICMCKDQVLMTMDCT